MKVYVARHGEAGHNLKDLLHDITVPDVSLTNRGEHQALLLAKKLKDVDLDVIYVSQLLRTQQTASIVNQFHNVEIIVEPLLNDILSGLAGRPFNEFKQMLESSSDPWNAKHKNGESFEDEKSRAIAFLGRLNDSDHGTVLVVTSGGIANILYGLDHGLSNEESFTRPIENADFFVINISKNF